MSDIERSKRSRPNFDSAFLRRLEELRLSAANPTSPLGERPGTLRLPASDVVDHRPYSPGDELRHIDWHALARHDELIVRLGRVTRGADLSIVLDRSPSMAHHAQKWRLSLEVVGALGWIALAGGDRVRLFTLDSESSDAWRGPAHAPSFLDRLTILSQGPSLSGSRIGEALDHVRRDEGRGGLVVVVSDMWLEDDPHASLSTLSAPMWETHVVQILAPEELEPRVVGPVELRDCETGETIDLLIDEALLGAYRARLRERLDRISTACAAHGASHALVRSDASLEGVVMPLLRRRALLD